MNSYLTDLECSRCTTRYSADQAHNLCACGAPLFARYDLPAIARAVSRGDLSFRVHSLWRYKELLPVRNLENVVTLSEGFTPLLSSLRLGPSIGLEQLYFKDESMNPTGSFKARGLALAVSKAKELGVREIALPTAGNAGGAAAAYAARAGLQCHVFMPQDTPPIFAKECEAYGAKVRMVKGFITTAGNLMMEELKEKGWFNVSTLREPYRVEGKKTIAYELAQQFSWDLPEVILFPTGGGTGIVGAWKAVQELKDLGWVPRSRMPRLIAVQASGCAPIVRAYEQGLDFAPEAENPHTFASGLRVPKAIGDFLVLRAVRESNGTAVAVSEESIQLAWKELSEKEGMYVAPEAAAAWAALKDLVAQEVVRKNERVVILITGSGLKYAI
jgi:threonine synthase